GWTADPKTGKLRGFYERFWADLELFLNWTGLFSKVFRPNRYQGVRIIGSRSNGSDHNGSGSNRERRLQIERLESVDARDDDARSPEQGPRGGARLDLSGVNRIQT